MMLRIKPLAYVLILAALCIPFVGRANGAWERYVDGVLVELSASPLSPLQGEQVGFILSFRDPQTRDYRLDIPETHIRINAFEVPSRPNGGIVFESEPLVLTDGSAEFSYRFPFEEPGIYDIHVLFTTPDGTAHNAGFLTSVRAIPEYTQLSVIPAMLAGALLGGTGMFLLAMYRYKR